MAAPRKTGRGAQKPPEPLPPQVSPIAVAVSAVLAVVAVWLGLPAGVVVLVGVLAGSAIHPRPELTGKHPVTKSPQPDNPMETELLDKYRFWSGLMGHVLNPLNLFRPIPATVVAVLVGVFAFSQPAAYDWVPAASAAAAAMVVAGWCAAKRASGEKQEPQPPVDFKSFPAAFRESRGAMVGHAVVGAVVAAAAVWVMFTVAGSDAAASARLWIAETVGGMPDSMFGARGDMWFSFPAAAVAGAALGVSRPWSEHFLTHWRRLLEFRDEWKPRWEQVKAPHPPRLTDFRTLGSEDDVVVFEFDTGGKGASQDLMALMPKLAPMLDPNTMHVATTVPNVGPDGQPQPGTTSLTGFEITAWPGGFPSLMQVQDEAVMRQALNGAAALIATQNALPAPIVDQMIPLRGSQQPGEAGMWSTTWHNSPGGQTLRDVFAGGLGGLLQCAAVGDHRAWQFNGAIFLGDLWADVDDGPDLSLFGGLGREQQASLDAAGDDVAARVEAGRVALDNLGLEDMWNAAWGDALKQTVNPPTIRHTHFKEEKLANGQVVEQQMFTTRQGLHPTEYMNVKTEAALTTSSLSRPFVHIGGWLNNPRDPGQHQQILVVHSSDRAVPAVSKLGPVKGSEGPKSVLAGYVAKAFDNARLVRPAVADVEAFTSEASFQHIWLVRLWLYGGVTLADVRKAAGKLQSAMQVDWLRVSSDRGQCVIVMGADPAAPRLRLARPDNKRRLMEFDWANLWSDAGVVSQHGDLPQLLEAAPLPQNDLVTRMVFTIPSGKSVASMRAQQAKLSAASGNAFVDIRPLKGSADRVEMMVAKESPMPFPAPLDFGESFAPTRIPYATGIDGTALTLNRDKHAHLGVYGTSGGGKSAAAQTIITGALLAGCEVFVADVQKGAADFKYAEPWLRGVATTTGDVLATMELLYAEKNRRVALNSKYGVGHCRDLPEDVRPPTTWFFLDEFFGMIQKAKPNPKPEADPELEAARQVLVAEYDSAKRIAFLTGRFAAEARSADIHLVVMTQKMTANMLDSSAAGPGALADLKTNTNTLLLGKTKSGDRASALRAWEDAPDLGEQVPPGRGIFEPVDDAMQIVQVWYADPREHVAQLRARVAEAAKVDLEPFRPRERGNSEFVELDADVDALPGGAGVEVIEVEADLDGFDFSFVTDGDTDDDAGSGEVVDAAALQDTDAVLAPDALPAVDVDEGAAIRDRDVDDEAFIGSILDDPAWGAEEDEPDLPDDDETGDVDGVDDAAGVDVSPDGGAGWGLEVEDVAEVLAEDPDMGGDATAGGGWDWDFHTPEQMWADAPEGDGGVGDALDLFEPAAILHEDSDLETGSDAESGGTVDDDRPEVADLSPVAAEPADVDPAPEPDPDPEPETVDVTTAPAVADVTEPDRGNEPAPAAAPADDEDDDFGAPTPARNRRRRSGWADTSDFGTDPALPDPLAEIGT